MKRILNTLFLMILVANGIHAQGIIRGYVSDDANGEPLMGVSVSLVDVSNGYRHGPQWFFLIQLDYGWR